MSCYSIGFMRENGDFQILATLNNEDDIFCHAFFKDVAERLKQDFKETLEKDVQILERQDASYRVDLGEAV